MKKVFSILISVIIAIVALTGCMQEKMGITINADGSATVNATIKIQKEYYDSQYSTSGNDLIEEIKQESPNAAIKEYEETIKGETYKCFDVSESYSSIAKVKKELFNSATSLFLFTSGTISKTKFVAEIGDNTDDTMTLSKNDMKEIQDLVKLTFSVTFPQKIVYTNGKLSKDKKTATWNLIKLIDGATLSAYTNKKEIKSSPVSGLTAKKDGQKTNIKWKKAYKVSGYQIRLGTNKGLSKNKKTVNIKKNTSKATVKGLKSNKQYYAKIRSYIKVGSKKYYSKWSKAKTVK